MMSSCEYFILWFSLVSYNNFIDKIKTCDRKPTPQKISECVGERKEIIVLFLIITKKNMTFLYAF